MREFSIFVFENIEIETENSNFSEMEKELIYFTNQNFRVNIVLIETNEVCKVKIEVH